MEKLFSPGKWFVIFCGLFVLIFAALKYVSNVRLQEEARRWGTYVFNWSWRGSDWASQAKIVEADVISHDDDDAVVRVKAVQQLTTGNNTKPATADCTASAILKLYKRSTGKRVIWELGEVEFP